MTALNRPCILSFDDIRVVRHHRVGGQKSLIFIGTGAEVSIREA